LAHVERLESRRPLAVSRLTWTIAGEDRPGEPADTILVDRDPGRSGMLRATVNDVVVGRRPEALVGIVRVFGGAGNDTITVNVPGNTRLRTQLFGNAGDDVITAGDQNDEIRGGGGKDTIFGGGGHDKIFGGADDDSINGGAGNDFVSGGADDDALVGAAGNDSLHGDTGRDTLRGGDGRNALDGGPGIDALYGTKDRDEVISSDAGEALIGNESTNPLRLAADPDQLKAWYIETAVARWGDQLGTEASWAWWRSDMPLRDGVVALAASPTPSPAQSGDFSGTNNQVAGVDEGDRVKTDGQHLFVLAGDGVDIVDAWPAESLTVVSHVATPGDERYLFLDGTRLTVISQESSWSALGDAAWGPVVRGRWYGRMESRVHVTVIDVADPARPAVRERTALDGWLVDARAIGSRVLVVTQDNLDIPSPATGCCRWRASRSVTTCPGSTRRPRSPESREASTHRRPTSTCRRATSAVGGTSPTRPRPRTSTSSTSGMPPCRSSRWGRSRASRSTSSRSTNTTACCASRPRTGSETGLQAASTCCPPSAATCSPWAA
jgi:hypothetical protein